MLSGLSVAKGVVQAIGVKRIFLVVVAVAVCFVGWKVLNDVQNLIRENAQLDSSLQISEANEEVLRSRLARIQEKIDLLESDSEKLSEDIAESEEEIQRLEAIKQEELERIRNLQAQDSSCDAAFQLLIEEARKERNQ